MKLGFGAMLVMKCHERSPFGGIDGSTSTNLLPNVNPNFEWIRLAQRLPVKITVNALPMNVQLRVGTTASVMINERLASAG